MFPPALAFDSPSSLAISAEFAWFQNENVGERFRTSFLLPHAVPKPSKNAEDGGGLTEKGLTQVARVHASRWMETMPRL